MFFCGGEQELVAPSQTEGGSTRLTWGATRRAETTPRRLFEAHSSYSWGAAATSSPPAAGLPEAPEGAAPESSPSLEGAPASGGAAATKEASWSAEAGARGEREEGGVVVA